MSNRPVAKQNLSSPKAAKAAKAAKTSTPAAGGRVAGSSRHGAGPWIVGVVLVGVVIALLVALLSGGDGGSGPAASNSSTVLSKIKALPASAYDTVGIGSAGNAPTKIDGQASTVGGKPQIVYLGAEYCPYCAAERWSMVMALSRFGTFSKISLTHSSSTDTFPNTQTFSFHGAEYSSDVISFSGTETQSNTLVNGRYSTLDTPSAEIENLASQYSAGSIPFVYFGGKYVLSGATYDPGVLQGKTAEQIATEMADPSSAIAKGAMGSANVLTAAICAATDQKPTTVCESPGVRTGAKTLGAG